MPRIRAAVPEATFHVVGRKPTAEVRALDGVNGCSVWGEVADVRPWLRGADIALVPLDIARGVQNKVLEAMAMTVPVVASPQAATGIPATAARDIAVGLNDADLAGAVLRLITDPHMAKAMGLAARRFVEREHDWEAMLAPLAGLVEAPLRRNRRHAA
jgi:glycosyltransferase involved in cell wall biosynthesis